MIFSLALILQWLLRYKYFVFFPMMILEGPIVTIIAGFLSSLGYLNPFLIYGLAVLGDLVGDSLYYALGRYGRDRFIQRWGHYIGLHPERIEHLEKHFKRHGGKTLILGKWSHAFTAPGLVAAGVAKMDFRKYLGFNALSTLPKSFLFLLIGIYFGRAYVQINNYLIYTTFIMIALAALLVFVYLIIKKVSKKYEEKNAH